MKRGIFCMCLSAFGFSLMAMFVRLADAVGDPLPTVQKAFFRNLVAIALALPIFLHAWRSGSVKLRGLAPRTWLDILLRAVFGTMGIFANFYALSKIPIGEAMALNKTAPFFTLVFCWPLMGERMTRRQLLCVAGAFAGALLVIQPGLLPYEEVFPASIGLFSGLCAGLAYALLHRLGSGKVNAAFIILFFSLFSSLACVPFILLDYHAMNMCQFWVLCGAGAGAALGQFGITWAYRSAEPRQVAVYDYSGIVFSAALGFLAFGQIPDALSWCGIALIVLMAFVRR